MLKSGDFPTQWSEGLTPYTKRKQSKSNKLPENNIAHNSRDSLVSEVRQHPRVACIDPVGHISAAKLLESILKGRLYSPKRNFIVMMISFKLGFLSQKSNS